MGAPVTDAGLVVPELGPLLGRLASADETSTRDRDLEPVRLQLLSALFEAAGQARGRLATGDAAGARAALGRAVWLSAWEQAIAGAGAVVHATIERRLKEAAAISRIGARRLAGFASTPEDRRVLAARLSAAGIGVEEQSRGLDRSSDDWPEALRVTAGELSGAWDRLRDIVRGELGAAESRVSQVRAWRRPWRPLVLAGTAALLVAAWIGLVLGGVLPVPGPLRPLAEWFWSLPWP